MNPFHRLLRWLRATLTGRVPPPAGPVPRDEIVTGEAGEAGEPGASARAPRRANDDPLVVRVRAAAFEHVGRGMYDVWSFDRGTLPPYIAELRGEREEAISDWRHDLAERLRASQATVETVDADSDNADRAARLEEDRLRAAERQEEISRAKMDWLAADEVRRRPEPPGATEPADDPADDAGGIDAGAADAAARTGCVHDRHPHECWEGLHDQEPLQPRTRRAILLGLVGIDVPIQYEIFRHFHGDGLVEVLLTWVFTVPVAAIMVLLPHLAGHLYRGRHRTGSERLMYVLPLAVLAPWFYLAWFLGRLRASVLLAPPTTPDGQPLRDPVTHQPIPTPSTQLHVGHWQVSLMYTGLLLATGGIAFLLGIAREHPMETAYRRAYETLRTAQQAVASTVATARDALSSRLRTHGVHDDLENHYEARLEEGIEALHQRYDRAELAYLEALAEAVGDPPFTEAVGVASRALLQAQLRPEVRERRDLPTTPTRDTA